MLITFLTLVILLLSTRHTNLIATKVFAGLRYLLLLRKYILRDIALVEDEHLTKQKETIIEKKYYTYLKNKRLR